MRYSTPDYQKKSFGEMSNPERLRLIIAMCLGIVMAFVWLLLPGILSLIAFINGWWVDVAIFGFMQVLFWAIFAVVNTV